MVSFVLQRRKLWAAGNLAEVMAVLSRINLDLAGLSSDDGTACFRTTCYALKLVGVII